MEIITYIVMDQPIRYILCDLWVNKAKNLGTSWSKSIVLENKVFINFDFRHGAKKIRSIGPPVPELWLSLNLAVKEQNERVYKCDDSCNFFCDSCKFALSQLAIMPRGMI